MEPSPIIEKDSGIQCPQTGTAIPSYYHTILLFTGSILHLQITGKTNGQIINIESIGCVNMKDLANTLLTVEQI